MVVEEDPSWTKTSSCDGTMAGADSHRDGLRGYSDILGGESAEETNEKSVYSDKPNTSRESWK